MKLAALIVGNVIDLEHAGIFVTQHQIDSQGWFKLLSGFASVDSRNITVAKAKRADR
jgi:hypothetical protein